MKAVKGIHHLTAISGQAHENFQFYTSFLKLRLVKKTVNFDDPTSYHLYYGDESGAPGSLLTFFPHPVNSGESGAGRVHSVHYPVSVGGLKVWKERLEEAKMDSVSKTVFGREHLQFQDPHGLWIELFESKEKEQATLDHFKGASLKVARSAKTVELLKFLGFEVQSSEDNQQRFLLPNGDYLDLHEVGERGRSGAGLFHHIALRVADREEQLYWKRELEARGYSVSPVMDRNYFESIYFRGPNGILFEIATDPPGMLIDESLEELGTNLKLPAQYEHYREEIELRLPALESGYKYHQESGVGDTIVTLHGTGGNEFDLLDLVKQIAPKNPILSLRGNVSEGGLNRFFKRLRAGVYDLLDLKRRAEDLRDFLGKREGPKVALGYSNGANLAAYTMLESRDSFEGAILLRPLMAWPDDSKADLSGKRVLILAGKSDPIVAPDRSKALAESLSRRGAEVEFHLLESGHEITHQDIQLATAWMQSTTRKAA